MFRNSIQKIMQQAKYEILSDDNSYYGEIPGFQGVYANANNMEDCRNELQGVLEEWILIRIENNLALPPEIPVEAIKAELAFRKKVDLGLQELDSGQGISHNQVKDRFAKRFR